MSIATASNRKPVSPDQRDVRALTEYLAICEDGPGMYLVMNTDGDAYTVDTESGACTCPDAQHNLRPGETCKHARRVAYETGAKAIPAWCDRSAIDPLLLRNLDQSDS